MKEKSDERPEEVVVRRGEGAVTVEKWLILPWEMVLSLPTSCPIIHLLLWVSEVMYPTF